MTGLLEGVKVVESGGGVALPAAAAMLADWGADVIKVEPILIAREGGAPTADRGYQEGLHERNKKSVAVDLKKQAGTEILHKLVQWADIFMTNYGVSIVERLKMDYATLSQVNPGLIYCLLSAYGTAGPDKDQRGYDYTAGWARSGMEYMVGEAGSLQGTNLFSMLDRMTGQWAGSGILAALLHKYKTGKGQKLEVSLYHTGVWGIASYIQMALMGTRITKVRRKYGVGRNPLWNSYRAKDDRWFQLAAQGGLHWPEFCRAIERPDLENDSRFSGGMGSLRQNCEELISILDEVFASKTMDEWDKRFKENDIIYGRVVTPTEVITDPQALANDFFAEVEHPTLGKIRLVTMPVKFHQDPALVRTPAPEKGQHTEEILLDLGYSWEDIVKIKEQEVIL